MPSVDDAVESLRIQIGAIEDVLDGLKAQLASAQRNRLAVPAGEVCLLEGFFESQLVSVSLWG